jgi:hypothetical protein
MAVIAAKIMQDGHKITLRCGLFDYFYLIIDSGTNLILSGKEFFNCFSILRMRCRGGLHNSWKSDRKSVQNGNDNY